MYNNQIPYTDFQRLYGPQVPYHRPSPDVVGEGDVIPANVLDGSVQLYFVPMLRRYPYPLYPGISSAYPSPATSECWYIRSICNENPSTFMNYLLNNVHIPTVSGGEMLTNNLTRDTSYKCYGNQYFQKFHNDHSTSTTDIHYFYPSLRFGDQKLSLSVAVQTDYNTFICCSCLHGFAVNSPRNTNEEMCVDDVQGTKSRYTNINNSDEKSNKLVATYTDASSNCAEGNGRQTQTAVRRMERCDVTIDQYVPRRKVRRTRRESCSSDCSCTDLR